MFDSDSIPVNPTVLGRETNLVNRRDILVGGVGLALLSSLPSVASAENKIGNAFAEFEELGEVKNSNLNLAQGFRYDKVIAFGDPIVNSLEEFNSKQLSAEEAVKRFGGNCDYIHFFQDKTDPKKGILCVNHESTESGANKDTKQREGAAYHSVGCSVLSVVKENGTWKVDLNSKLNRRITPATPATITGPAAGNERLKSTASPDGIKSAGTLGNCAGGFTPWGTYLTAEENIQSFFAGGDKSKHKEAKNMARFGMGNNDKGFSKVDPRFDLDGEAQSFLHFGWIVEIDPLKPEEPIKKHTSIGRCKHECAGTTVDKNGHVVVYSGDDQQMEYIYKFVSAEKYRENDREHNKKLLESGTLYVAQFHENGVLKWLPLKFGEKGLTEKDGFASQGDILLDTRSAADAVGATPMDRPEDIDIHPQTGKAYFFMTGNSSRGADKLNVANPVEKGSGHIIEIDAEHHKDEVQWRFILICGKDLADNEKSTFHPNTTKSGRLVYPDNGAFDTKGNLWVCSDGYGFPGFTDGMWLCQTKDNKTLTKRFASPPKGAELTGPCFTPDGEGLFLAVQHPGSSSDGKSFPDFNGNKARSTVVYIRKG